MKLSSTKQKRYTLYGCFIFKQYSADKQYVENVRGELMRESDVVIVGGGITGLMSAYFLNKNKKSVIVIDKDDISSSASFGNAGLFSPFEKNPLSYPGVLSSTLKLMLLGKSPVVLHPRFDLKQYVWLSRFMLSANKMRLKRTLALFDKYGTISKSFYKKMIEEEGFDFDFKDEGLILIYTQQESFEAKLKSANDDSRYKVLDFKELKKLVPIVNEKVKGGILLKRNAFMNPAKVMNGLKEYLQQNGVEFVLNEEIEDVDTFDGKISSVIGNGGAYKADEFIFSTGYYTKLQEKLGINLMQIPAKGYSITFKMDEELKPKVASLYSDLFIALTPRSEDVRVTSKLEIGARSSYTDKRQIDSIIKNLKDYSIDFEIKEANEWAGFRPLPPNDMPLIGRDEKYPNLIHANGLGWLGLTMGPVIGNIVNNLVTKNQSNSESDDILLFSGFYQN